MLRDKLPVQLRLDRLGSLYLAAPLFSRKQLSARIPILMYHSIQASDGKESFPYYETTTSPLRFAEHMAYLSRHEYQTIGLGEVQERLRSGQPCERCIAITFDDGFSNFYVYAYPILKEYGFMATVFLPTAFISTTRRQFNGKPCMTWSEVRELNTTGITFGSHTVTHPQLRELSRKKIEDELRLSRQMIEENLGTKIDSFAYPFAFPEADAEFRALLTETLGTAGYTNGVCTTIGRADPLRSRLFMKRLPVNSCDDQRLFQAKLAGAYDWVGTPQRWFKMAKDWLPNSGGPAEAEAH
jgi:peptidoglycan/xylan/chitin deacetylase (PgdA/CDA1 family)